MRFLNPWGLLALLAIPALIALYILKQKHTSVTVPSLFLWKKTKVLMEVSTPWQKLRRSLLFFLQLLAVICLALAIANPAISSSQVYDETIVVIDASASMRAKDGDKTRYERAIDSCCDIADTLAKGQKMSVIFACDTVFPSVSHSDSRYEIKNALKAFECRYSGADLEGAVALADSMRSDSGNCRILVYTDFYAESNDKSTEYICLANSRKNTAILSFKTGYSNDKLMAMCVAESFGEDKEVTLELLCDGNLCDAKKVSLKADEASAVYWNSIPANAALLTVRISESDVFPEDNEMGAPVDRNSDKKILIVSESGFFIEKALRAVSAYDIYKMLPADFKTESCEEYDLCIFDGYTPASLPKGLPCWFLNPAGSVSGIGFGSVIAGSSLRQAESPLSMELCEYVNPAAVIVSKFREINSCEGWTAALSCGEYPVLIGRTDEEGAPMLLLAFDIHDSNLPLLKEFPILFQNMLSFSMPVLTDGDGVFTCGSAVTLHRMTYSVALSATGPDGKPAAVGDDSTLTLGLPGVYTVSQTIERKKGDKTESSTVNGYVISCIPEGESAMSASSVTQTGKKLSEYRGQLELRPYICILLLLVLTAEWWVYNREN